MPETFIILTPGFPANETDTACVPPQQLFVKTLKELCPDLNIIVITFHYPFSAGEYLWNGVRVFAIDGKNKSGWPRLLCWVKAWRILKKQHQHQTIVGLLSFWFGECAFVGSYFARYSAIKHLSWVLGQDAKKGNKFFKWIKPGGNELVALSDFLSEKIIRNYKVQPAAVIPVGIDRCAYPALPQNRDIDMMGAGSLINLKQYRLFITCLAFIKQTLPGVKAIICGNGPEKADLQAMAIALNVNENIEFKGELPQPEILALMQQSKVFLHPSAYEGFGAVIGEALYAGAHVVSFCKPMNKDFKNHYVVKNQDEMNCICLSVLTNPFRQHSRVLTYDIRQTTRKMVSLFAG